MYNILNSTFAREIFSETEKQKERQFAKNQAPHRKADDLDRARANDKLGIYHYFDFGRFSVCDLLGRRLSGVYARLYDKPRGDHADLRRIYSSRNVA